MASGYIEKTGDTFFLSVFDKTPGGYSFREKHELRSGDAYLSSVIEKLDTVLLNVPFQLLHFRVLMLPFSEREKIEDVIPFQLEGMTVEPIADIVYDFMVMDKTDDKYKVMVVFAHRESLKNLLEGLSVYGIKPESLTSLDVHHALSKDSAEELTELPALADEDRISTMSEMFSSETINLAKGEFSYRGDIEKAKKYLKVSAVLGAVLCVLVSVHLVLDWNNNSARTKAHKQNMTKLYAQLVPEDKKIVNPLYQLKSQMKQIQWKVNQFNDCRPLNTIELIAKNWLTGGSADSIKITLDSITLKGEAAGTDEVQAIADSLTKQFESKPVIETKQAAGEKFGYTIQVRNERE